LAASKQIDAPGDTAERSIFVVFDLIRKTAGS